MITRVPSKRTRSFKYMFNIKGSESSASLISELNRLRILPGGFLSNQAGRTFKTEVRSFSCMLNAATRPPFAKENDLTSVKNELIPPRMIKTSDHLYPPLNSLLELISLIIIVKYGNYSH